MSTNDPCPCPEKQLVINDEALPENSPPKPDCIPIIVNPPDPSDIPGKCDSKIRFQIGQNGCPGRYWGYVCESGWIGFSYDIPSCIKATDGMPIEPPLECDLPIKYDACTGIFWYYTCEGGWKKEAHTLCFLEHLDDLPANICDQIKVPLFFNDPCCKEGFLTLREFVAQIWACGCPPEGSSITPGDGKLLLYCNGDSVVIGPLDINFCTLFGQVEQGTPVTVPPGGSFTIFDPVSCSNVLVSFEEPPCCDAIVGSESGAAQSGACILVNGSGVFQWRDLSQVEGTGGSIADVGGATGVYGVQTVTNTNAFDVVARIRFVVSALERETNAGQDQWDTAISAVLSEDLNVPLPNAGEHASLLSGLLTDSQGADFSRARAYRFTGQGDLAANASVVLEVHVDLAPGQSRTFYANIWYAINLLGGAAGVVIVHAYSSSEVIYYRGSL